MIENSDSLAADERSLKRDWRLFSAAIFLFIFGFQVYGGVFQNFLKEVMGADALGLGRLESLREIPGFLAALSSGLLVALAEARIAGLGLFITGVGIMASGYVGEYWPLVAVTVFWSIGFHLFASVQSAITLALAKGKEGGRHLGRMNAVSALGQIGGLGAAWALSRLVQKLSYPVYFNLGGVAIIISSVLMMMLSHHSASGPRQGIVFRKEYWLYYLMAFLDGCRRQIFSIFASFALIIVYDVPVGNMLFLQFINALLIAVTAPQMGKLIDRVGEKGPLTWYAIGLILVFIGYASFETVGALYALFLLDHILFSFGVGITTYLHRIVRPGELTPSLAMGVTMNHVAAVTVPYFGALLWKSSGNYQAPFWVGVIVAVVALGVTRLLPDGPRAATPAP